MKIKSCENCGKRWVHGWDGLESCMWWDMTDDPVKEAKNCGAWVLDDSDPEGAHYTPSACGGDYGPSNPWDAPGMSIRDFI